MLDARNILEVRIHIFLLDSSLLLLLIGLKPHTASVFGTKTAYVMARAAPD